MASAATPSTNCDISNTTESNNHAMFQQIPNHQPMQQSQQQPQLLQQQNQPPPQPRGRSSVMQQSIYQDSTNVNMSSTRQASAALPPLQPHGQAKPWPLDSSGQVAPGAASGGGGGGYNFQRIMDDHFEHYKRPASREQSIDRSNLPQLALAETVSKPPNIPSRGRSGSRQPRGQASASGAVTPA